MPIVSNYPNTFYAVPNSVAIHHRTPTDPSDALEDLTSIDDNDIVVGETETNQLIHDDYTSTSNNGAILPGLSASGLMITIPHAYTMTGSASLPLPTTIGPNGVGGSGSGGGSGGPESTIVSLNPNNLDTELVDLGLLFVNFCGAGARVNMFDMPVVVNLVLPQSCVGNPVLMNYPINRTDFRLIRGVPNVIQFFVRDVDRHIAILPLANATLTANIVDVNTQTLLLHRDLFVVNAATCLYGLSTQPADMVDWPTGYLGYSIQVKRADGSQTMLWTDRDYSPYGYCTLTDGPIPPPVTPKVLDPTTFVVDLGYSYSSPVPGAAARGYPDGTQTFSFYTNNYTANVFIEASLVPSPATDQSNWFKVADQGFVAANGVTQVTVEGNFLWLRVALPNSGPVSYPGLPYQPFVIGNVSQILYLN